MHFRLHQKFRHALRCRRDIARLCLMATALLARPRVGHGDDAAALFRYEGARACMGSTFAMVIYGPDEGHLPQIAAEALDEVDRIDRLMSDYKPSSPLSQINREAAQHRVVVVPELYDFLKQSVAYSTASAGAFDITVGPLMKAWGPFRPHEGHVPSTKQRRVALGKVGFAKLQFFDGDNSIGFARPAMAIDLGGIAKGYAVDRAVAVLRRHGISRALVTSGGSSAYALGRPPNLPAWELSVADPFSTKEKMAPARKFALADRALSVAGISQQSFKDRGATYGHILNPRTGWPVQGILSLVVTSATATEADALDTMFFVLGVDESRRYLSHHPGIEAIFSVGTSKTDLATITLPDRLTTRTEEAP